MRRTCLNSVYELARKDKRVFFVGSDLGVGTMDEYKKELPDQFSMEGISEQHMIGMAAGLAMEGNIVYANTIAVFLTRRTFEQVCLDLCLHEANVRLIGNGGGLVYAPLGPTHLCTDDIAILRTLPNITILAPSDAREMELLMPLTLNHQGPIYIRLAKGGDKIVTPDDREYEIGKAVEVKKGKDALIITTGIGQQIALDAVEILSDKGLDAGVLHLHTIKPLDVETITKNIADVPVVISVEEGVITGGLGSAVAEIMAETDFGEQKKFRRIGIPDQFVENFGSQLLLLESFGITAENVARIAMELSGKKEHNGG